MARPGLLQPGERIAAPHVLTRTARRNERARHHNDAMLKRDIDTSQAEYEAADPQWVSKRNEGLRKRVATVVVKARDRECLEEERRQLIAERDRFLPIGPHVATGPIVIRSRQHLEPRIKNDARVASSDAGKVSRASARNRV